ncbi:MAG: hypothetical protein ACK583_18060 [Cyanobacteriota bacterium]|jgi:hypothetical protein
MGMSISRERAETHTSAVEGRALQAGIALAMQHRAAAELPGIYQERSPLVALP